MNNKDLAPPVFMRHMHHTKDPLPAIGQSNTTYAPPSPYQDGGASGEGSPQRSLEESPTAVVGSLAVARRRARHNQQSGGTSPDHPHAAQEAASGAQRRSPSPQDHDEGNAHVGRMTSSNKTKGALMDVLDPDADGSTVVVLVSSSSKEDVPRAVVDAAARRSSQGTQEDELTSGKPKATHRTCAALLDVLDPDADGSTIVDVLPPSATTGASIYPASAMMSSQPQGQQQRPPSDTNTHPALFHRGFQ